MLISRRRLPRSHPSAAFLACALVGLGAGCAHQGTPPDRPPGTVRVATWNILYLNLDLDLVAETIRQSEADVVLLQEVTGEAAVHLDQALKGAYPHRRFDGELGVLSRTPPAWVVYAPPEHRRRGVQIVAIPAAIPAPGPRGAAPDPAQTARGATILVANVHLEAQVLDDPLPHGIVRSLDHAERTHVDELKMLLRRLDPGFPHVIAGDFNSLPAYASRTLLRKNGYLDAADTAVFWPGSTWSDDAIFGVPAAIRIDYVFVKGGLEPLATGTVDTEASDHHLLWVDLGLPRSAPLPAKKR